MTLRKGDAKKLRRIGVTVDDYKGYPKPKSRQPYRWQVVRVECLTREDVVGRGLTARQAEQLRFDEQYRANLNNNGRSDITYSFRAEPEPSRYGPKRRCPPQAK